MRQAFADFDAWTVKFAKILGVVSDGRSGLNLLGRSTPVSAFAGRFRLLANRRSRTCSVRAWTDWRLLRLERFKFAGRLRGIFAAFCRRIYTYAFEPELIFGG